MSDKNIILANTAYTVGTLEVAALRRKADGSCYKVLDTLPGATTAPTRPLSATAPVMLSGAAVLLDKILLRKQVCAYASEDALYCEIDRHAFLIDKEGVHITEEKVLDIYILWAMILYIVYVEKDIEVGDSFKRLLTEYLTIGAAVPKDAGLFCDCLLYSKYKAVSVMDDLVLETVRAAYRSGAFTNALGDLGLDPQLFPKDEPLEETKAVSPSKKSGQKTENEELWGKALRGDFVIDYEWDEESRSRIRPLSFLDHYIPNEIFFKALKKLNFRLDRILQRMKEGKTGTEAIGNDAVNIALIGDPGTGKTTLLLALCAAKGLPFYVQPCSQNTDETDFTGKISIIDNKVQNVFTECVGCHSSGGIIDVEEANLAQPACLQGTLGQAIEYPYILMQDGWKPVERHPLCVYVITGNTGTAGSKPMSEAFKSRFQTIYKFEDATRKDFIAALIKKTGIKKYICEWVYDRYSSIVKELKSGEFGASDTESILLSLSLRACIGALQNIEEGSDPKTALTDSIINNIWSTDREVALRLQEIVDTAKDLYIDGDIYEVG